MSNQASTPFAKRLEGKVVIITGGASGIGEATTRLFWSHGAKIVIADIQDDLGEALCRELDENAMYVHCDVTDEEQVKKTVDLAVEKYGKLDIMYNNAGVADCATRSILTIEKSDVEKVLGVNLIGGILGAKHAARVMVPAKKGCIIFTTSASTSIACTLCHGYIASKQGLLGIMRNIAAELGQFGIRVNSISPYAVVTNLTKSTIPHSSTKQLQALFNKSTILKGTDLKAEDIARAALYLASEDGQCVSGLNLVVDGAFSITYPSVPFV
ncbi:hypothetical protein GIB67_012707 [Kingdonia uniflora]|uniref:Secoisolariciresinol dehydrogenase n=1 Tax=Kingdonia uniflora TaxID=39325 RepID=A0A7J7NFN3_9MAGN|nr:hypothetical protein GIB67_012707 [Kingdonia uniflora]